MIVFNIAALLQAILLVVIGLLLELFGFHDWADDLGFTSKTVHTFYFYGIYFILAATDRRGLKGRLFWIPTWALALVWIVIYQKVESGWEEREDAWLAFFNVLNYVLPILLGLLMLFRLDRIFQKKFEIARIDLLTMNKTDAAYEADKAGFWATLSHAQIHVPKMYLYAYQSYRTLHRNTVALSDFVDHYLLLIDTILPKVTRPENKHRLTQFRANLEYAKNSGEYNHEMGSMKKLSEVMQTEYELYKS